MKDRSSERIEYITLGDSESGTFFDLSATGAGCHFAKRLEKDSIVSVKVNDLVLKAKVVYCQERRDGYRLGLQFLNVSDEQQKTLDDCIAKFSRGVSVTCGIIDRS